MVCYTGATTSAQLLGMDRLKETCASVHISTDDGSAGYRGLVTELFGREVSSYKPDESIVYACGPAPMLNNLSEIIKEHSITCQVLLEQRMACGVGACLGCVVGLKNTAGESQYARVCADGPVFDIQNVNCDT
jgi:dihydroorotate dehydrogenase electron transfer subunit